MWILAGFVTAEPQRELPKAIFSLAAVTVNISPMLALGFHRMLLALFRISCLSSHDEENSEVFTPIDSMGINLKPSFPSPLWGHRESKMIARTKHTSYGKWEETYNS